VTRRARVLMVQGTGSGVGKSVLVSALCRILKQDGLRVAPFKAQNMALNSHVCRDGGEIGRAQAVQAAAAGVEPTVEMNPILIKPGSDTSAQVIVKGRVRADLDAGRYYSGYGVELFPEVVECLDSLRSRFDAVVAEGAGSPAEVNLRDHDIVNMRIAVYAGSPVLLVADIDRGGALASIVGTYELLPPSDRRMLAGFVMNKFRGDRGVLEPGLRAVTERTGLPSLGVIPFIPALRLPEEDAVPAELYEGRGYRSADGLDIAVVYLPHISNFTDFDPLVGEAGVSVRYVSGGRPIGSADLVIVPGSKNVASDLLYLHEAGYTDEIRRLRAEGVPVMGICGGFQMLGEEIRDPHGMESSQESIHGIGLLPLTTVMRPRKVTAQVRADLEGGPGILGFTARGLQGYEIHMGRTDLRGCRAAFVVTERNGERVRDPEGAVDEEGLSFGTYVHGIFDDDDFRSAFLGAVARAGGVERRTRAPARTGRYAARLRAQYDRLAAVVRSSLDMERIYRLAGLRW